MKNKSCGANVEELKEELVKDYREHLDKIFASKTFDLTFDEREKLIDATLDKGRCKILEEHIEKDPDGVSKNNYQPDETCLCHCGTCAPLCRGKKGEPKVFEREIITKRGIVNTTEYGYYCQKCRKVFFPSPEKAAGIQRKLQP
ncbi:MAG: hypothetical protein V2A57_05060 [Elusimicrobiota bacterium]